MKKNAGVQWAWANSTLRQLKDQEEMDLVHHYLGTVVYKYVKKTHHLAHGQKKYLFKQFLDFCHAKFILIF